MISIIDIEAASENDPQRQYLGLLNEILNTHTDDIYDTTNLMAAMEKFKKLMIDDWEANYRELYDERSISDYYRAALADWVGFDEMDEAPGDVFILPPYLEARIGNMGNWKEVEDEMVEDQESMHGLFQLMDKK